MKRVGNIYERIISRENCQAAVLEESRTNRLTRSGRGQELRDNLEAWTSRVQARMSTLPFVPQPTHKFSIMEGGKLRHIEMNSGQRKTIRSACAACARNGSIHLRSCSLCAPCRMS